MQKNQFLNLNCWKLLFQTKSGWAYFILAILCLITSFILGGNFINYVETRNGYTLNDWILNIIPSYNCNIAIFIIEYTAVIFSLIYFSKNPGKLIIIANTYSFIVLLRMLTMLIVPLNPPKGLIILHDPIIHFFTHQHQTKDLFFSGHTAFVFALCLIHKSLALKILYTLFTLTISLLLLIQRVHYSIDIFGAIPSTFLCFWLARRFERRALGLKQGIFTRFL